LSVENSTQTLQLLSTALECNYDDPLRPEVRVEELGFRGGGRIVLDWGFFRQTGAVPGQTRYQCWFSPENNNSTVGGMN
jgi:hypothetical protein